MLYHFYINLGIKNTIDYEYYIKTLKMSFSFYCILKKNKP